MKNGVQPARPGDSRWKQKVSELRARRRQMRQAAQALGLDPDSPKGIVLCEFLLGEIFGEAVEKPRSRTVLLRQLQLLLKTAPTNSTNRKARKGRAKSLKQHLDQLYGPGVVVEEEADSEEAAEN